MATSILHPQTCTRHSLACLLLLMHEAPRPPSLNGLMHRACCAANTSTARGCRQEACAHTSR